MAFPTKAQKEAKDKLEELQKLNQEAKNLGEEKSPETKEPTIPLSQVEAMIQKALEGLGNNTPLQKIHTEDSNKEKNTDVIPGMEDFEFKDRVYISLADKKAVSQGIRSRHKKLSPLQWTNPKTKTVEAIRYTSNHHSIFESRQKDQKVIVEHIQMKDGILRVPASNTTLQTLLHIHPDNGIVFKELDEVAEARKIVEEEDLLFSAQQKAREISFEVLTAVARVMIKTYSDDWSPAETKQAVYAEIKKNPRKFITLSEDRNLINRSLAKTAVSRGVLHFENRKFFVVDGKSKDDVMTVDFGEDEYDAIAKFGNTTDGKQFFKYIESVI